MHMNLAELTARTGLDVLDHLETQVAIPVLDGLQAQGDLLVIPFDIVADAVIPPSDDRWRPVPRAGIEVLRGAAGGNPHTLTAEHGTCRWTDDAADRERLTLGMLRATRPVYLIHPEHGASGIAPGTYVIRRQRERAMENRRRPFSVGPVRYIAD
ncbi:hypothetical protein GQ466_13975 [Actinomadura rayongensis]|uniref:Uncharacterized protein n=2 Tax=Actinomadura rayongensis TaxID=1429076 RepID=A0A6I4WDR8_9ACTN|nr:hypothetical protein [Actinomadura rayongensis]